MVEDLVLGAGIVGEGENLHWAVADRASQRRGFIDARQQH